MIACEGTTVVDAVPPCVDDGEVVADSWTVAVEEITPVVEGVSDNPSVGETFVILSNAIKLLILKKNVG